MDTRPFVADQSAISPFLGGWHVRVVQRDALLAMHFRVNTLSTAVAADDRPAQYENRDL